MTAVDSKRAIVLPLALVWLAFTLVNLGKAAHVDDAAHLEIARWIAAHPLHPMSGLVDWSDGPAPIHHLNQPHLFFYLLALAGPSLIGAQLVVAAFGALGIASFHAWWRRYVGPRGEVLGPALLFLGPAYVPGQNVMTDAPLLALWCAFGAGLVARSTRGLVLAAIACAAACLVKYTSLVLLPILALDVLLRGRDARRLLLVLLIPIGTLAAWSLFNLYDYGGVHLVGRPIESARFSALEALGITFGRGALWILTLGAASPFVIAMIPVLHREPRWRRAALISAIAIVILTVATQLIAAHVPPMRGETIAHSAARAIFFVAGIAVLALVVRSARIIDDRTRVTTVLVAWLAVTALFVIVLSPFVAMRHVLLVMPIAMTVIARAHLPALASIATRPFLNAAIGLTVALGMLLGISDRRWAERYREVAAREGDAAVASGLRTFFVGHWGWQWYAANAGLEPYAPGRTELRSGDRIIRPWLVDQPAWDERDAPRLELDHVDEIAPTPLDWLRTTTDRLGYYSVWHGLPYTISGAPVERFETWIVDRAISLQREPHDAPQASDSRTRSSGQRAPRL
ncbi:ArnT family glycosyltransferase [Sandaracinus amylolyticus]|uniref:ArnT family glycosyltransferase n=1 Tax=Sandaracinus amylolyticus TaxID=927083 RepID=UPI001F31A8A7|nr:hypothetical protein [Sandaracinus amylolyticus]UJR87006.1 Hypothetical protein I5071_91070 [Sandaracinus amylolyticus]